MLIIYPPPPIHMKICPTLKLCQVRVGPNIVQNHSPNLLEYISGHSLYVAIHMKQRAKLKLGQVAVGLNNAQNH